MADDSPLTEPAEAPPPAALAAPRPGRRPLVPAWWRQAWLQEVLLIGSVVLMLAGLDQWSKAWVVERHGWPVRDHAGRLRPPHGMEPTVIVPGALRLIVVGNEGAIWGIGRGLSNRHKRPLFIALSLLAVAFIGTMLVSTEAAQWPRRVGFAAVLAGAIGNLWDRLARDYVIDFIDWSWGFRWPTFNVADIAITAGVLLVMIDLFWHPDPPPPAEAG